MMEPTDADVMARGPGPAGAGLDPDPDLREADPDLQAELARTLGGGEDATVMREVGEGEERRTEVGTMPTAYVVDLALRRGVMATGPVACRAGYALAVEDEDGCVWFLRTPGLDA